MEAIETEFQNATAKGILPGVLLAASNRDGKIINFPQFHASFHPNPLNIELILIMQGL
jgi:hypothetical protein